MTLYTCVKEGWNVTTVESISGVSAHSDGSFPAIIMGSGNNEGSDHVVQLVSDEQIAPDPNREASEE